MLVATRPPETHVLIPAWLEEPSPAERYPTGVLADPYADLNRSVEDTGASRVILSDLRPFLSNRSFARSLPGSRVVAIDHGSDHIRILEEGLTNMGIRRGSSALRHLAWRESMVRRSPLRLFSTNPQSPSMGSRRLRSSTRYLRMPIEELEVVAACRWPNDGRQRLTLIGALQPRKGLDLLAGALLVLRKRGSIDIRALEIVVAGRASSSYRPEVYRLMQTLRRSGFDARLVDRYLQDDEYSALLTGSDVVVLPYDRFIGGSGILGSLMGKGVSMVVSDYGWLGRFAADRGAYTYRNGDVAGLSVALRLALIERRGLTTGGGAFVPKEVALRPLWNAIIGGE